MNTVRHNSLVNKRNAFIAVALLAAGTAVEQAVTSDQAPKPKVVHLTNEEKATVNSVIRSVNSDPSYAVGMYDTIGGNPGETTLPPHVTLAEARKTDIEFLLNLAPPQAGASPEDLSSN